MDCPKCNKELLEEFDYYVCEDCSSYGKCSICSMPVEMDKMESDICGHNTCVEKKAERMFR